MGDSNFDDEDFASISIARGKVSIDRGKAARKKAKAEEKRTAHEEAQERTAEFTPAQRLMRAELHPPVRAGETVAELTGMSGSIVTDEVLAIINEEPSMTLSFGQWAQVQRMMERAYRVGTVNGYEHRLSD